MTFDYEVGYCLFNRNICKYLAPLFWVYSKVSQTKSFNFSNDLIQKFRMLPIKIFLTFLLDRIFKGLLILGQDQKKAYISSYAVKLAEFLRVRNPAGSRVRIPQRQTIT